MELDEVVDVFRTFAPPILKCHVQVNGYLYDTDKRDPNAYLRSQTDIRSDRSEAQNKPTLKIRLVQLSRPMHFLIAYLKDDQESAPTENASDHDSVISVTVPVDTRMVLTIDAQQQLVSTSAPLEPAATIFNRDDENHTLGLTNGDSDSVVTSNSSASARRSARTRLTPGLVTRIEVRALREYRELAQYIDSTIPDNETTQLRLREREHSRGQTHWNCQVVLPGVLTIEIIEVSATFIMSCVDKYGIEKAPRRSYSGSVDFEID
jgi:hypothetical protein